MQRVQAAVRVRAAPCSRGLGLWRRRRRFLTSVLKGGSVRGSSRDINWTPFRPSVPEDAEGDRHRAAATLLSSYQLGY